MTFDPVTMWLFRGRGRNIRLLTLSGFLLVVTFVYLEYNSIATISSDQPMFISIESGYHANAEEPRQCSANHNIAYVKMMKSASTTLSSILRRYGYANNLSFVLPIGDKIYLGWPFPVQAQYYRKRKSDFNILCDHVVYNSEKFHEFMPDNSVYISSIREPFSQFVSTFNYYNLHGVTKMAKNQTYEHYLRDIDLYEKRYVSHEYKALRYCVPDGFSVTRNIMSFNLGFPSGFNSPDRSRDPDFIQQWLRLLEREFLLVLIVEHFHESLVLLRRKLCWKFEHVLFVNLNTGDYKHGVNDKKMINIHRNWSNVDYSLYKHFNDTLWNELANQDADFWREVSHLKLVAMETDRYCDSFPKEGAPIPSPQRKLPKIALEVKASPWNSRFIVDEKKCQELQNEFQSEVKKRYDQQAPLDVKNAEPKIQYC